MTAMADITVKNTANVDVVFTALTASGGDGNPAIWRATGDTSIPPALQTTLTLRTQSTADKKGRRAIFDFQAFYTAPDTTTGLPVVVARMPMKLEMVVPQLMPAATAADYALIALNTAASSLIKSSIGSGFAPR